MKLKLVIRQIACQHDCVRIIPPETAVLPVATEILSRRSFDTLPRTFDVVRTARAVNQSERRPDRVIATEYETISNSVDDRSHPLAIGLDARCTFIVKVAAVNRAPEVCVELEIGAAP